MDKMYIIVRKDLKMSCGKIAGQVGHACLSVSRKMSFWENYLYLAEYNEKKIILKVHSYDELKDVMSKLDENKIDYVGVHDMGLTQVEMGTLTCIGIVPTNNIKLKEIVEELQLL